MIEFVKGNLVTENYDVFCHQVNCRGVMGSGIAKQIRETYPEVFNQYLTNHRLQGDRLGTNLYVKTNDGRVCVNMYAQDNFGRDKCHTDYAAFRSCLIDLKDYLSRQPENITIGFPYKIGCGLAGGDWAIVGEMIKEFAEQIKQKVFIVILE